MSKARFRLLFSALVLMAPAAARSEPAVLGLARAYLGPESTLEGLKTVRFIGTLDRVDQAPGSPVIHNELDMVFEKPLRQHMVLKGPKLQRLGPPSGQHQSGEAAAKVAGRPGPAHAQGQHLGKPLLLQDARGRLG